MCQHCHLEAFEKGYTKARVSLNYKTNLSILFLDLLLIWKLHICIHIYILNSLTLNGVSWRCWWWVSQGDGQEHTSRTSVLSWLTAELQDSVLTETNSSPTYGTSWRDKDTQAVWQSGMTGVGLLVKSRSDGGLLSVLGGFTSLQKLVNLYISYNN